jgi:hypothetical protein
MNTELLATIDSLPIAMQEEVKDFVDFLKEKLKKSPELTFVSTRKTGVFKGKIELEPDFDEPLEDFKEYIK